MAGRINDDDVAEVRNRVKIDEVVSTHVALRNAGGGSLKGLCPFHDEKTPSFQVTPARGFYYCFGCGEGGDAITFLQKMDNLSFTEAIERLADRAGVQLRRVDDGGPAPVPGQRLRILEANKLAAEFFSEQLTTPDALAARQFLDQRGFDRASAEKFGVGFAPRTGRALRQHLNGRGFSNAELLKAGLIREAGWDFFQSRLLWPIRDSGQSVLGFGARRIFEDDRMPAKYINTPETTVYKKSQVLYGLDLARQPIGKRNQAVVVEGYTDVMAAHLAGVETAVASCGTAFGDDHARMLQRLMGHSDVADGEVIFTFDGDQAGQNAALKVFKGEQRFISQTYVAIEPTGLDPCDLRLQHGDAAVRELVARRVPLYKFVMTNVVDQFDLDRVDGRLAALRAAAPLVSSIRDTSLVSGYAHELAGILGMDPDEVRREFTRVRSAPAKASPTQSRRDDEPEPEPADDARASMGLPEPDDRRLEVERGTCKLLLQHPELFPSGSYGVEEADFTHPAYRSIFAGVEQAGPGKERSQRVRESVGDPGLAGLVVALSVEPLMTEPDARYAAAYCSRLRLLTASREIADLKSKLQRTNPVEQTTRYNQMFSELLGLEQRRRQLHHDSFDAD